MWGRSSPVTLSLTAASIHASVLLNRYCLILFYLQPIAFLTDIPASILPF